MTTEVKTSILDRWVPVLVSTLVILVGAGMAYGRLEQRVVSEERARLDKDTSLSQEIMPIEQRVRMFVTRNEWEIMQKNLDQSLKDIKDGQKDIKAKLDALAEKP